MSDIPDPLERELTALSPRAVSPDLRQRVADRLTARPARRWPWALGLVAVLASAGVVAVFGPWEEEVPPPAPPVVAPAPPTETESPDPAPSVLAYRQALARSPEQLAALLDKHATASPDTEPVAAFTRSNTTLDALLGDD